MTPNPPSPPWVPQQVSPLVPPLIQSLNPPLVQLRLVSPLQLSRNEDWLSRGELRMASTVEGWREVLPGQWHGAAYGQECSLKDVPRLSRKSKKSVDCPLPDEPILYGPTPLDDWVTLSITVWGDDARTRRAGRVVSGLVGHPAVQGLVAKSQDVAHGTYPAAGVALGLGHDILVVAGELLQLNQDDLLLHCPGRSIPAALLRPHLQSVGDTLPLHLDTGHGVALTLQWEVVDPNTLDIPLLQLPRRTLRVP